MTRLLQIIARIGLAFGRVGSMFGARRGSTSATEPRRLFDHLSGAEGRERQLLQAVEWAGAAPEPAPEVAVKHAPSIRARRLRLAVVAVSVPVIALTVTLAAVAYWTTQGTGSASASTGTLNAATDAAASSTVGTGTVQVTWTVSASGGEAVAPQGYYVTRWNGVAPTLAGGTCGTPAAPVNQASCDDTSVADGTYTYTVVAVFNSWTAESDPSNSVSVVNDNTPPTNSLTLTAKSPAGSSFLSGSTVFYRGTGGGSGGSFKIRNAVADSGSGPASSTTSALGGTTTGWTHTPSTASAPGGPYDSNTFTWAEGTSSAPTVVVTGADAAGNTTAAPALTFTNDSTAPNGGALSVNGQGASGAGTSGYSTSAGFLIDSRTDYTDGGSGIASSVLTVQSFVLSSTGGILNGTCGAASAPFPSPTVVTGTTQPPGIVTATCYTYTLTGTDNLGNVSTVSTTVKVDATAPNAPTLSLSTPTGSTFISGTTAFINAQAGKSGSFAVAAIENDLQSGIQSVGFPLLTGFTSGGGLDTTSGYSSGTYSWSGAVGASGPQTVTGTNFAGLTNSSTFTVAPDTTGPINGALSVNSQVATGAGSSGYSTSTTFLISPRINYTDPGSGLAASVLTVQSFVLSSSDGSAEGTCNAAAAPFASPTVISGTTQPGGIVTARCYTYTLTGTDNVGNASSISTTVKVDTTAPSAPTITLSAATGNTFINGTTAFINAQSGKSGSFSASATTADNESGVIRVVFPTLAGFATGGGSDFTPPYVTPAIYAWSGAVTASGAQAVSVPNFAGGTPATSSFTVTPDTANPTGGALTVNGGSAGSTTSNTAGSFSITARTNYTDAGSGLASSTLVREDAALVANLCDTTWANATTITTAVPVAQGPGQGIASGKCYRYTLTGTDNVDNTASILTIVKVDTSGPTFGSPALTLSETGNFSHYPGTGTVVYYNGATGTASSITVNAPNVADPETGIQNVIFPTIAGFTGGVTDTSSPYSTTYTWASSAANGSQTVTATNGITTTNTSSFTLTRDVTAPTGGSLTVNGTAAAGAATTSTNTTGTFSIGPRTDYTDAASGLLSSDLVREQATLNADFTCGTFGSATTLAGTPAQLGLATNCYRYTLTGTDNVGNTANVSTIVKVDTVAPTATNVTLGGNNGLVGEDDTITVTYSEVLDASTFCNNWINGADQSESGNGTVVVTITNSGVNDVLTVAVSGCGTFRFGNVALGRDYVTTTRTYSGNGSNASSVAWDLAAKTLTITLGTPSGAGNPVAQIAGTPSYTADTGLKDRVGNAIAAGPYTGSPTSRL